MPAGPAGQGGFLTGPMNPSNDYGMGSAAQANPCTSRCTMFGFQADLEYLYTHGMIGIEHRYCKGFCDIVWRNEGYVT